MNKRVFLVVVFLLLSVLFVACSNTTIQKEDRAEQFLRECFTINKDHRFDALEKATEEALPQLTANSNEIQSIPAEIYETYYQNLKKMATEICLDSLEANRIPGSFDQLVVNAGLTAQIDTIKLTPAGDNAYTLEITYDSDDVNTLLSAPITGQVTVQEENGTVLVAALRISSK